MEICGKAQFSHSFGRITAFYALQATLIVSKLSKRYEIVKILQLRAKFETLMVSYSRLIKYHKFQFPKSTNCLWFSGSGKSCYMQEVLSSNLDKSGTRQHSSTKQCCKQSKGVSCNWRGYTSRAGWFRKVILTNLKQPSEVVCKKRGS